MVDPIRDSIWRSNVNTTLGMLFVGTFAFAAAFIIWNTAYGYNPLEHAFTQYLYQETAALQ